MRFQRIPEPKREGIVEKWEEQKRFACQHTKLTTRTVGGVRILFCTECSVRWKEEE